MSSGSGTQQSQSRPKHLYQGLLRCLLNLSESETILLVSPPFKNYIVLTTSVGFFPRFSNISLSSAILILPLEFLSQTYGGNNKQSILVTGNWTYFQVELLTENASWYFSTSSFERLLNISVFSFDLLSTASALDILKPAPDNSFELRNVYQNID